jgi:PKD repeat protein
MYYATGIYTVSLTVSDGKGLNTMTKKDYVVVNGWDSPNFAINNIAGVTGETVKLPIYFYNTNGITNETTGFTAKLKYNATLLYPKNGTPMGVVNSNLERVIDILLPAKPGNNGLLTTLEFMAMLGNAKSTDIELYDIIPIGKQVVVNKSTKAKFSLLNVSEEGGTRLVKSTNNFSTIKSIEPNPAIDFANIGIASEDESYITLELYNVFGEKVKTVFEGEVQSKNQEYKIETADLKTGIYYLVLKNNERTQTKVLNIVK